MKLIPYHTLSDDELWTILAGGNRHVLSVIYQRYYEIMFNYGMKCCKDGEVVKDCIQDIFVILHLANELSINVTVRSYLLRSLHNTLFDKYWKNKDWETMDEEFFQIPNSEDLFEQLFVKSDEDIKLLKQLHSAITQLSVNQRNILYLRYVRGLSHKEISEILNISTQSSMNLSNRALTKLRAVLSEKTLMLLYWLWIFGTR